MEMEIKCKGLDLQAFAFMFVAINKWYGCVRIEDLFYKTEGDSTIVYIKLVKD